MTGWMSFEEGATPLTPEEMDGLVPTHITLKRELNELEQANILNADLWAFRRKRNVLDPDFLKRLHKRMFGDVWKWAGSYRTTPRNIGVEPWKIEPDLRQALDDAAYWIEHRSFPPDEIAVRLHHRLVQIHPFPNGNGRWSRLAADLLIVRLGGERFTWGRTTLRDASETRRRYIAALQEEDRHEPNGLIAFARS